MACDGLACRDPPVCCMAQQGCRAQAESLAEACCRCTGVAPAAGSVPEFRVRLSVDAGLQGLDGRRAKSGEYEPDRAARAPGILFPGRAMCVPGWIILSCTESGP